MKILILSLVIFLTNTGYALDKVKIGTTPAIGTLVTIASEEGFFKQQGLEVEIKQFNTGKVIADALISKDIDFGTIVDSNLAFIGFNETDLQVVATLGERLADSLYFLKNSQIKSPKDLKDKKIGYAPGTSSHIFLNRFLIKNGLGFNNIKSSIIQPQSALTSLRIGAVDAVSIWEPWGYAIREELGDKINIFENNKDIYVSRTYLGSTKEYLSKNPEITKKVLRALKQAEDIFRTNPEKTYSCLSKVLKIKEEAVPIVLKDYSFQVKKESDSIKLIQELGNWIKEYQDAFKDLPLPDYKKLFSVSEDTEQTTNSELTDVKICRPNNMVSALLYIADKKNFFINNGLQPTFQTATNAKICQDVLVSRGADFMSGGDGPFTYLSANNPPLKILAQLETIPEVSIFARKDKGILKFPDLKGKRIGYLPGTVSYMFLGRILKKHQISRKKIKLSPIQPPSMPQALIGGAVDAFSMWEPWGSMARERLGDNFIKLEDTETYQYISLFMGHEEALLKNDGIPLKMLNSLIQAKDFIKNNNQEAFEILQKEIKFEEPTFRALWPRYEHKVVLNSKMINLFKDNFSLLKEDDENFKNYETPNFNNFINSSFLKSIDPTLVETGL